MAPVVTLRGRPTEPDSHNRTSASHAVPVDLHELGEVLPGSARLGPVHTDPTPPGVSLSDPTDTASLYAKAGLARTEDRTTDRTTGQTAASEVPPGTPGISTLSEHVEPSCSGTGTDLKRVQVLYVREAATSSRYTSVLPLLLNEVANVDDVFAVSAQQSGGERRVRWVHENCVPVIPEVVVPNGSLNGDFTDTITALENLGYTNKSRKYVAFTEANDLCGVGTMYRDASTTGNYNDGYAASYSRVDQGCWSVRAHSVVAHELTHNIGSVLPSAPHATTRGHCFDEYDLMCYNDGSGIPMQKDVCTAGQEQLLDCNGDDYFNTAPQAGSFLADNWNTASSGFLDTPPHAPLPWASSATTWSAPTATKRDPALVSAVLTDATAAAPVAAAAVVLQSRAGPDRPWQTVVSGLTTGPEGRVSVQRARTSAAWYRFSYAGDSEAGFAADVSAGVLVKAGSQLRAGWRSARHRVTGLLQRADGSPIAGATVNLQRRYAGSSKWVTLSQRTTTADGRLAATQRPTRTAYFRWVYRGSDLVLGSRSAAVRAG